MDEKELISTQKKRSIIAILLFLVFTGALLFRLMSFQLINGDVYLATAQKTTVKTIPIDAPRGEIVDCYGRSLAVNRTVYCVQLDLVFMPAKERNDILLRLIKIMENENEEYFDDLPVSPLFPYSFKEGSDGERFRIKGVLNLDKAPESANVVMDTLKERYRIPSSFTEEEARKVCGVRYTMELRGASTQTPYIFAEDVSVSAVTTVKENSSVLSGSDIVTRAVRQYYYGDASPDVVGIVGLIDENELKNLASEGYVSSDYIGKFGIEKSMESYLRGKDGEMQVTLNSRGQVISSTVTKEPVPGATVMLTIDAELSRSVYKLLKTRIEEIAESDVKQESGYDCAAGSVVLTDPNTGGVIVSVNYPSYDLNSYYSDYGTLLADPDNPLFNRAEKGLYPPGSTFKAITALAGLEEKKVFKTTKYTCKHTMLYADREYDCNGTHGALDIVTALAKSCNIYFYNTGLALGFDNLREYASRFGFGQKTGIEISEEAGAISKSNIMMTSIGQANTLVTPLQLSSYAATLANGGTRYRSTVIKKIVSHDYSETLLEKEPEVLNTVNADKNNWALMTDGLYSGVNRKMAGYYTYLYDADYVVATKTGTAQVPNGSNNGMFICYAPFDAPTAALSIALEHAGSGNRCAPLARQVLDDFFKSKNMADSFN